MDIMRLRHAPLQLRELFHPHVSRAELSQPCEECEKQTLVLFFFFLPPPLPLSPTVLTFIMKIRAFEGNNNKQLAKEDTGG